MAQCRNRCCLRVQSPRDKIQIIYLQVADSQKTIVKAVTQVTQRRIDRCCSHPIHNAHDARNRRPSPFWIHRGHDDMPGNTGRSGEFVAPRLGGSCTCDPVPNDGSPPLMGSLRDGGKPWGRPHVRSSRRSSQKQNEWQNWPGLQIQPTGVKMVPFDTCE